ncbi:MAG: hypothetical protein LBC74_12540 [Planctomycetaceae bacterium]|nr:hypothetical protein [Planctomycetaceae bacterium]
MKNFLTLFTVTVSLLFFGCNQNTIPTVPIKIVITYKGKNVDGALVTLNPVIKNGTQRSAAGMTDTNGHAAISTPGGNDGAMEGDFKVTVMKTSSIGSTENIPKYTSYEEAAANSATTNKTMDSQNIEHLLPIKYASENTTDITISVKKGNKNNWIFDLKD